MHPLFRLTLFTAAAAVLVGLGAGLVSNACGGDNLAAVARDFLREVDRSAGLAERVRVGRSYCREKAAVTAEFLAGRLSLDETAEAFRHINAAEKAEVGRAPVIYPGLSDEEAAYRNVVAWVESQTSYEPERTAQVLPGLRAAVNARFGPPPGVFGER